MLRLGEQIRRRVAVLDTCTVKNALRFLSAGSYLVLEVYDKNETHLFDLPQNQFAVLLANSDGPYAKLGDLYQKTEKFTPPVEK